MKSPNPSFRRWLLPALGLATLAIAGCNSSRSGYVNALTLEVCEPNEDTLMPLARGEGRGRGDQCVGTGPGDNCDDTRSGKIDCIGDGNSGQGDDKKHNCVFPQPGCDEEGCCDDDVVEDPEPTPDAAPETPPEEPSPDGGEVVVL